MKIAERWFVWAGMVLLGGIALAGLVVAVYAAWLFHDLPDASELADYRPPTATRVYAGDGTLIGEFSDERRIYVSYDQIPLTVVQAFLAAEDRNFFQHGGIDVGGIGRASIKNIFNLVQGRRLEGGSTITQQVAKNVLLTNESSLNRKLKEAILANRLEATLSKEQILNLYLNEIFLGYRSFGIASAAYNYFGKSLAQLTPDEAAFLASLPKGPNNYHPKRHPGAAKGRRDWVLGEMEQSGWLTEAQLVEARARPLVTRDAPLLKAGSEIPAEEIVQLADVFNNVNNVTLNANKLVNDLDDRFLILANNANQLITNLNGVVSAENRQRIDSALANVDAMLAETRPSLRSTMANIDSASAKLGPTIEKADAAMAKTDTLVTNLNGVVEQNRDEIHATLIELRRALEDAKRLMTNLDDTLVSNRTNLDEALENIRASSQNLKQFTDTIKRRPFSLIRIKAEKERVPPTGK